MIGAFRQHDATDLLIKLLESKDDAIKNAVIKSLREMNASKAEEKLIGVYEGESTEIQHAILKSLETIGSVRSLPLYENILRQPLPDLQHALLCVKALHSLGDKGRKVIGQLEELNSERIRLIISHASDSRL
jgi:HEAT repeat protein